MKPVKSVLSAVPAAAVIAAVLFAASCNNALLPEPEIEQLQGSVVNKDAQIEAPLVLTASQGYKNIVTLKWEAVTGAVQYIIYAADEPQDTFKEIMETKGTETSKTITETAGTSRYYKVCAKDYYGNLSVPSEIALGSTLAIPVITEIQPQDDGSTVIVKWWMENCNAHTYQSDIEYKIEVFEENEDGEKKLRAEKIIENTESSTRIENLTPLTKYYYQVSAYLLAEKDSDEKTNIETSNLVDEATARRIIPGAPVELSAEKGLSEDSVKVSWKLPAFCDVSTTADNFEKHPLYFSLERKLKEEPDDSYQKLATYIGTRPKSSTSLVLGFDCTDASKNSPDISITSEQDEQEETSALYPEYVSLQRITYTDRTAERDKQYTYRVQSFVDDVTRTISSDTARDTADGWKIATCIFEYAADYTTSADSQKFEKVRINFRESAFNEREEQYVYFLVEEYRPLADENGQFIASGNPAMFEDGFKQVQAHTITFDFAGGSKPEEGYYRYQLYICKGGSADYKKPISTIAMQKTILVTDDENKFVKVTYAAVDDGYADRFRLSWNYESHATYTIFWENMNDGTTGSLKLEKSELDALPLGENSIITYDHAAKSGDRRKYTIKADAGIPNEKAVDGEYETLGTVVPEQNGIAYDKILFTWKAVQQAQTGTDSFIVKYADGGEAKYTIDCEDDIYTCAVDAPIGYDDPATSGKSLTFKITAKGEKHADQTTTAEYTAHTLGPALINAKGGSGTDKTIVMTWDKVEGANGYLIYRTAYKDADASQIESSDMLYYPATDDDITGSPSLVADGQIPNKSIIITKSGGKYTLQDTDTPAPDNSSEFQKNQSRISWGRPFGYIVLPVKDKDDFTFKVGTKVLADGAKVDYTKSGAFAEAQGNTYGYGINTAASKSDSTANVTVEWKKPNAQTGLVPTLYRRAAGTDGSFAKVRKTESLSATDTPTGDDRYEAFEYVVKYDKTEGDDTLSVPASLLAELAAATEGRYVYPDGRSEPQNKGYLFALRLSVLADEKNMYYEAIDCDWDYSKRGIGPDKFTLSMYNNNIKDDWVGILTANGEGSFSVIDGVSDIVIKPTDRQGVFSVAPAGIAAGTSGTTDGMLKVLRDYKHYYKLKAEHKNKNDVAISYEVGADKDIYAYRQITAKEFLIVSMDTIRSSFKKKWYTDGAVSGNLNSTSFSGSVGGICYTGIDRNGFFGTNYRRYQRFADYKDSFVEINGTMMKDNGGGVASNQYQGTWLHKGSDWPSDSNFLPQEDCLTVTVDYLIEGQIKLNSIKITNNKPNEPDWESGTFEVTYNGKNESFGKDQVPFGFLMDDDTFYSKVEEMCY
ncbi:MAG: fibronectin type III domain-containing protein [Treponemataceae bacterium]|nr:fibronectin type III domain-containing protein [Treponemataceae bacterium]